MTDDARKENMLMSMSNYDLFFRVLGMLKRCGQMARDGSAVRFGVCVREMRYVPQFSCLLLLLSQG